MYLDACLYHIQKIGHSYIVQTELSWTVPHEICTYLLYVCYNSENKQQQYKQQQQLFRHSISSHTGGSEWQFVVYPPDNPKLSHSW